MLNTVMTLFKPRLPAPCRTRVSLAPQSYHHARLSAGCTCVIAALLSCLVMRPAHAQYHSETRIQNSEERVTAEARSHHRDLRDGFGQQSDVAEELSRMPELRVRRTGASNAPAYISIRGSEQNAVAIHLEGIPLNGRSEER